MSIKPKETNFEEPMSHMLKSLNYVLKNSFDFVPECVNSLTN